LHVGHAHDLAVADPAAAVLNLVELSPAPQLLPVERAAGRLVPRVGVGGAAALPLGGGAAAAAAARLAQQVAQHVAHPGRGAAEELRQGPHRLAVGVGPEAALVPEGLEIAMLDDVIGLGERPQAGVRAVQGRRAWRVRRSRASPNCPCRAAVESSLTCHAPFVAGDERRASVYPSQGGVPQKTRPANLTGVGDKLRRIDPTVGRLTVVDPALPQHFA
jgi:hypothetical protein